MNKRYLSYILVGLLLCIIPTNAFGQKPPDKAVVQEVVKAVVVQAKVGDEYTIVGPNESLPGNLCTFHANVPEGAKPTWVIIPKEATANMYVDSNGLTSVFASRDKGTYYLAMAVTIDGQVKIFVHELVNDDNPNPNPDPDPDPDPGPEPDPTPIDGTKFVIAVVESEERGGEYGAVLMGLRTYLREKNHPYRYVDPDFTDGSNQKPEWFAVYEEKIARSGIELPVIVIGDVKGNEVVNIVVKALPKKSAEAIALVKERGG